jgi:hypothetical protein
MRRRKEVVKFASGWEAFHAVLHAYLWYSGLTTTILGYTATPAVILVAAPLAGVVSVRLGLCGRVGSTFLAWRPGAIGGQ